MILVTTAGKIGAEASSLLAQRGAPVRVLVRNPEKVTSSDTTTGIERDCQRRSRARPARGEDHEQSLGRFTDRAPARPVRNRAGPDRVGPWLHVAEKQRVHAELPDDGPCDR